MAAVSRPLNGRMAEPGPIMASAHKDARKALAKIAAGQGVGTVQSRGGPHAELAACRTYNCVHRLLALKMGK